MAASRKPPKASGQQKKYRIGEPDPNKETHVPCPVCRKGMVPASIAAAVREVLEGSNDGPNDKIKP